MASIAIRFRPTNRINLLCGLKLGVDGNSNFNRFSLMLCCEFYFIFFLIYRFNEFGGAIHQRPIQDLAFAVARFVQKGGSFVNYYMVSSLIFTSMT